MEMEIDDDLYNRQLYVLGFEAMRKMGDAHILVVGLNGLGAEITKNIVLSGVGAVTLYDPESVVLADLSTQFFLSESNIGKPRAACCVNGIAELNEHVDVMCADGSSSLESLILSKKYDIVVLCNPMWGSEVIEINRICREVSVSLVAAESRGVCAACFCDFGDNFVVSDSNGEEPFSGVVTSITQDERGTVTLNEDQIMRLEDGDFVSFEGVKGMNELNTMDPIRITVSDSHSFVIADTSSFKAYEGGGYVREVKQPKTVNFMPFEDAVKNPEYADGSSFVGLHVAFQAFHAFHKEYGRMPNPYDEDDAANMILLGKQISSDFNEDTIRKFSFSCSGDFCPITSFIGGMAGQEVLKAASGKFMPIKQFFYFEDFTVLPQYGAPNVVKPDTDGLNTRYERQIAVLGNGMQMRLQNQRIFLVGAGALGCEFLKCFALMGVGNVTVTDMDAIETSNLSRQFLFRRHHVGKMKSKVASDAALRINPGIDVKAFETKLGKETEDVFSDSFWEGLSCVCNALDNVETRLYVDSKCLFYEKPFVDSGTLGAKGNIQAIIPYLTETYGSSRDPPEKQIPICTLKNFPYEIEHTIQWARDTFEGLFKLRPENVNSYLSKKESYVEKLRTTPNSIVSLLEIVKSLTTEKPLKFEDCVVWARHLFEELFCSSIKQLLFTFPPDMNTSSGTPFWTGTKRAPIPLAYDENDPIHVDFVVAAANLHAAMYGLSGVKRGRNVDIIVDAARVSMPEFVPKRGVVVAVTEGEQEQESPMEDGNFDQVRESLPDPYQLAGFRVHPAEFEKDNDANYHLDFISATANLRARNYSIPEASRHKIKLIAGKIMPAMVTTTALVTGLACLELVKIFQRCADVEQYRNSFINVALPLFSQYAPLVPPTRKFRGEDITMWNRIDMNIGDVTLSKFMKYFEEEFGLEINMISSGQAIIYSFFGDKKKIAARMQMKMSEVVCDVTKKEITEAQRVLTFDVLAGDTKSGEDVDVPFVKYKFR